MNSYSGVTRAVLLARGVTLPSPGTLRDKMLRKGLVVEQEQKQALFEGVLLALQVLHGTKDSYKLITKILEQTKSILNYEIFTKEYYDDLQNDRAKDLSMLNKLSNLGLVDPANGQRPTK